MAVEVHTIWGELAWQLLGKEGYALVAEDDQLGVSPGSEVLRQLFVAASPVLVLIDEWVVFARQLYGKEGLPAGSFEANLSFAQNLTEAAKAAPRTLIVGTIPASESETGGEGGQEAAIRLKQIFGRVESPLASCSIGMKGLKSCVVVFSSQFPPSFIPHETQ